MRNALPSLLLLALAGCGTSTTSQTPAAKPGSAAAVPATAAPADSLQQAVATYVKAHADAFPDYQAVGWGKPVAYTKAREAAIKGVVAMKAFDDALVPRNKALQDYKTAVARRQPAAQVAAVKARYGKANKYNDSLLRIANSFLGVKDTARLGTEIAHTYRTKGKTGATVLDSTTFVVYRNGKVDQL